jgi:plasmid maintenance system antidote protein VapI
MSNGELLQQLRDLIDGSGESRYSIAKETGISQSQLCKLMAGTAGLSIEAAERLLDHFGYGIQLKKRPKQKRL